MWNRITNKKENGFTLLEVLIGLILMTAIGLMFLGYTAGSARKVIMAREMSEANRIIDNEVERFLAYTSTTPSTTLTDFTTAEAQGLLANRVESTNRGNFQVVHTLRNLFIDGNGNVTPASVQQANIIEVTIEVRPLRNGVPTQTGVVRTVRLR